MASVLPILNAVRLIIQRHVVGDIPFISPVSPGDTTLYVKTTLRLQVGDEIILTDGENEEHDFFITAVVDNTTITTNKAAQFAWTTSAFIRKAFNGLFIKGIYLGEPDVIPMYPAITVNINTSHSEFYTTRATKERYQIEVGVLVEDANQESGEILLWTITDRIQAGLKKNIYPLVNSYITSSITADIADGDYFVKVPDSSIFTQGWLSLVEDTFKTQENIIDNICDATTIKMQSPLSGGFSASNTTLIIPQRFIFNSWPADITFGKIYKGTLLKGSVISWFAEEMELQFNKPWTDTQLT